MAHTSLYQFDRVLIRELAHAAHASAALRAHTPYADQVMATVESAAQALYGAARTHVLEEADDAPARAARDRAIDELRARLSGLLATFRARLQLETHDLSGTVTHAARFDAGTALLDRVLPQGRSSGLSESGPRLLQEAQLVVDGLAALGGADDLLAALAPLLAQAHATVAAVEQEARELTESRRALDEARAEALRVRRAARAFVAFASEWYPELGLSPKAIFPGSQRSRSATEAESQLDAAGVPQLDDSAEVATLVDETTV